MLRNRYFHFLILILLGLAIYSNALWGPFVLDDRLFILRNPTIRSLSNFLEIPGTRYIGFLSFALNYAVGGYDVFGYNLVNIVIHIINSILVYQLVSFLLKTPIMGKAQFNVKHFALLTSLLFLTHPIETQAVNYVVQRFASLATLFYLLSITLYLKARLMVPADDSDSGKGRYLFYGAALVAAATAQITKEMSFTLPFVIVLFEFTFFPISEGIRKKAKRILPFLFTLAIIPASILLPASKGQSVSNTSAEIVREIQLRLLTESSPYDYLLIQFKVIVLYFKLLVFPVNQNMLHDVHIYDSFFVPETVGSFVFLAALFALTLYLYLRSRKKKDALGLMISIGMLWFFITISVESSVIPLVNKMFEHRLYLPSVGFFISVAAIFLFCARALSGSRVEGTKTGTRALAIAAVVILVLSALTYKRNYVWMDDYSLWSDTLKKSPENATAHNEMGTVYLGMRNKEKALYHYRESIRINPRYAASRNNIGNVLTQMGLYDEAMAQYMASLEINPSIQHTLINIGINYSFQGRFEEAIVSFQKYIDINPNNSNAFYNYAMALARLDRLIEATENYRKAIELNPSDANSRNNLANILMQRNDLEGALALYMEVVSLRPSHAPALNNLGIIMNIKKRQAESLVYYERAIKADPGYASAYYNMGITLEDLGKFNAAVEKYRKVIRLAPEHAEAMNSIGSILLKKNDYANALEYFKAALNIDPGNLLYRENLRAAERLVREAPNANGLGSVN